jgi:hypothetical protein
MFRAKEVIEGDEREREGLELEVSDNSLRVTFQSVSRLFSLMVTRERVDENGVPKCYKYIISLDSKLDDTEVHLRAEVSDYTFTSFPWLGMPARTLHRIVAEKTLRGFVGEVVREVARLLVRDFHHL